MVLQRLAFTTLIAFQFCSSAYSQDWAHKMFKDSFEHDFGTVARAADAEYVFEFQNIYKEDIRIAGVRASCGCVTPVILKKNLKTWDKGGIKAVFNTKSFLGRRNATITVTIDRPYYAEVQLKIKGHIRGDVVFNPGIVDFGSVELGETATQTVNVNYAGRSDWQIVDVQSANPHLEVELHETQRFSGRVGYEMKVNLKDGPKAGHFNDQMVLVTNDRSSKRIPIQVSGNVLSPLQVSPHSLSLGVLRPGETISRNVVLKSKKPFRIIKVKVEDGSFEIEPPEDAKKFHLVPVKFTAKDDGKIAQTIEIETDLGKGAVGSFTATATVRK